MTLQEHLPHDLPDYAPSKRPVRIYKDGRWWTWYHSCLHDGLAVGQPHTTHEWALLYALKHWRRCP